MRRIRSAAALLLALAAGGCGLGGPPGGELDVTIAGEGSATAPLAARLVQDATTVTLADRDEAGETVAGLASSWRFLDDGASLILRLRPARWPDGREVTARAVVDALRRAGARNEGALALAGLGNAGPKLVLAPTSRVVELRMAGPSPLALAWLAEPALAIRDARGQPLPGPYRLTRDGKALRLERRDEAPAPAARPGVIRLSLSAAPAAAITSFRRQDTALVISEGLAGLNEARSSGAGNALRVEALAGVMAYRPNTRTGPLANPDVRRALALTVDRAAVVDRFGLAAMTAQTRLAPGLPAIPDWRLLPQDLALAEAQRRLAAAGHGPDRPLTLRLLLPPGLEHRQVAADIAAGWAPLGIVIKAEIADPAARRGRITRGDYDLALEEVTPGVADPAALLWRLRCSGRIACVREADALLDRALTAPLAARPGLLAEAESRLMAEVPLIPLTNTLRWALVGRRVEGFAVNPVGLHPLGRLAVGGD